MGQRTDAAASSRTRLNATSAILGSGASGAVIKCAECGTESPLNIECEYCHKTFCEKHMPEHKAWEHRHENLAEDSPRLWKRSRESPYRIVWSKRRVCASPSAFRGGLLESTMAFKAI